MTDTRAMHSRTIKIRVEAEKNLSEKLAEQLVKILEKLGYEVIEWSRAFPTRDDETRARSYVAALPKAAETESEEK